MDRQSFERYVQKTVQDYIHKETRTYNNPKIIYQRYGEGINNFQCIAAVEETGCIGIYNFIGFMNAEEVHSQKVLIGPDDLKLIADRAGQN